MLINATLWGCAFACVLYPLWGRSQREASSGRTTSPSIGLHGALIEPRK